MSDYRQLSFFEPIQIPVSKSYTAIIDPVDADLLQFSWCYSTGYARARCNGKKALMHRVILERKIGRALLPSEECDHIDRNRLNNRRDNLRVVSQPENARNRKVSSLSKTGYKGVVAPEGRHYKYRAHINLNGKRYWLGSFDTAEEAHAAYCKAAKELFGEFANLD